MARFTLPAGVDPASLILYLAQIGVTLTQNQEAEIRAGVVSDNATAEAEEARSESLDAPQD